MIDPWLAMGAVLAVLSRRALGADPVHQLGVPGHCLKALAGHLAEEPDRVLAHPGPGAGVDRLEQVLGRRVPTPAEVRDQLLQRRQRLR